MNFIQRTMSIALYALPLVATSQLAQAQISPAPAMPHSMPQGHMNKGMMGSEDMKKTMMSGMDSMNNMSMTGNIDKDFALMMKIHHQQAVDMSEMQLAHGKSAPMKTMARNIISAQKKEIAMFDKWLVNQK